MASPVRWLRRAGRRGLFVALRGLAGVCGLRHAPALGKLLGELEYRFAWRRRGRCARDMALALGRPVGDHGVAKQLRHAHHVYAQAVFEILAMFARRYEDRELASRVVVEGMEHLRSALTEGRGAILLGTHSGNGALLAVTLAAAGLPMSVVYRRARMMSADFFERGFAMYGVEGILANEGMRAYSSMRSAVKRGRIVFVTLDQGVRRAGSGVLVRFLGKDMKVAAGPAQLSRRARAPVLPVMTVGHRDAWRFRIEPPLPPASSSLESDVERMTRATERQVLLHPELWSWHQRRWHLQPFARAAVGYRNRCTPS